MDQPEHRLIFRVIKAPASMLMCSTQDKLVLICLVDRMKQERNGTLVWPSQELLAEQAAMGERTVRRSLKNLCDLDLIKLQRTTGRHNVYSINIGLIHRLLATGLTGRSEKGDRPDRPVSPAAVAGQTGPSGLLRTKEEPTEPILPFGSSVTPKVSSDPVQRKLVLHGIVAETAQKLSASSPEEPNEEKKRAVARRLATGEKL